MNRPKLIFIITILAATVLGQSLNVNASALSMPEQPEIVITLTEPTTLTPTFTGNGNECNTGWHYFDGIYAYITLNSQTGAIQNYGEWRPNIPSAGNWKVEVRNPVHPYYTWPCSPYTYINQDTASAKYEIHYNGGTQTVTLDQQTSPEWVEIGTFPFVAGISGYITLGDVTGESSFTKGISFSGMRFTQITDGGDGVTYDRAAAVNWASQNNRRDARYYGDSEGRYCTTYIAQALNAGGLNTSTNWYGNQQIIQWMLANPNAWEEKPLDQLVGGDFILYSPYSHAPNDWSYIDPTGGWSLWWHSAMVVRPGYVAAWNAEQYDIPMIASYSYPYQKGVHIRDTNSQYQGELGFASSQIRNPNGIEHVWSIPANSSDAPMLFDIKPISGNLTYRILLKNSGGQILADTHSSSDGRGIVALENLTTDTYYLHIIPDIGTNGEYEITAWHGIPKIDFSWGEQYSYINIRRWQAYVGETSQNFYVKWYQTSGNLHITWELRTRDGNLLSSGTDSEGEVFAQGMASDWVDFYITSVTGDGSYHIGIYPGTPGDTIKPTGNISIPSANATVGPGDVYIKTTAWDNGGSGIKRVRLYVYYDGDWHHVDDEPGNSGMAFEFHWHPGCISSQTIQFGIHVEDNAGNYKIDPVSPISVNLQGAPNCEKLADGIYLRNINGWQQERIAIVDLQDPNVQLELLYDRANPLIPDDQYFQTHTVMDFINLHPLVLGGEQIDHYYVAINGAGFAPDGCETNSLCTSAGMAQLGISGVAFGPTCAGQLGCIGGAISSFFAYNSAINWDSDWDKPYLNPSIFRAYTESPTPDGFLQGEKSFVWEHTSNANPGFIIGYNCMILDAVNPTGPSDFPQYVGNCAEDSWENSDVFYFGYITVLGISYDGSKVFMATVNSNVKSRQLAQDLYNLGAARAIVLDSGWMSPQFQAAGENGRQFLVAPDGFGAFPRMVTSGILAYSLKPAQSVSSIQSAGGSYALSPNAIVNVSDQTFATTINFTVSPLNSGGGSSTIMDSQVAVSHENQANGNLVEVGITFETSAIYPDSASAVPSKPFEMIISYNEASIPSGIPEATLGLYYWNGSGWAKETTSVVDIINNTVSVTTSRTGKWTIMAFFYQNCIPLVQR